MSTDSTGGGKSICSVYVCWLSHSFSPARLEDHCFSLQCFSCLSDTIFLCTSWSQVGLQIRAGPVINGACSAIVCNIVSILYLLLLLLLLSMTLLLVCCDDASMIVMMLLLLSGIWLWRSLTQSWDDLSRDYVAIFSTNLGGWNIDQSIFPHFMMSPLNWWHPSILCCFVQCGSLCWSSQRVCCSVLGWWKNNLQEYSDWCQNPVNLVLTQKWGDRAQEGLFTPTVHWFGIFHFLLNASLDGGLQLSCVIILFSSFHSSPFLLIHYPLKFPSTFNHHQSLSISRQVVMTIFSMSRQAQQQTWREQTCTTQQVDSMEGGKVKQTTAPSSF